MEFLTDGSSRLNGVPVSRKLTAHVKIIKKVNLDEIRHGERRDLLSDDMFQFGLDLVVDPGAIFGRYEAV